MTDSTRSRETSGALFYLFIIVLECEFVLTHHLLMFRALFAGLLLTAEVKAACPFSVSGETSFNLPSGHPAVVPRTFLGSGSAAAKAAYANAVTEVDWAGVKNDIVQLLDSDQAIWPADDLGFKHKKKSYIGLFGNALETSKKTF